VNLEKSINSIRDDADMLHVDVMDGHFVPNITIGIPVIKAINERFDIPLDVHLMIENPDRYIKDFIEAGSDLLTVHYEACVHLNRNVAEIKERGAKAFVALNPHTPVFLLKDIIEYLDGVLIMSVNPGFGGQKFIKNSIERIKELDEMKKKYNPDLMISVDGGVNKDTVRLVYDAGVTMAVAGSAVFKSEHPAEQIKMLKGLCDEK
jgi:ribulose-phosphate 3-epimerase